MTFFCLLFICFLPVKGFAAESGDRITVTATVSLQPAFAQLIEKNSHVSVASAVLYPRESLQINIYSVASGKEVLRDHAIRVLIKNAQGRTLEDVALTTNKHGQADTQLTVKELWLGTNEIVIEDHTYPNKTLILEEKPVFSVIQLPKKESSEKTKWMKPSGAFDQKPITFLEGNTSEVILSKSFSVSLESHETVQQSEMHAGP